MDLEEKKGSGWENSLAQALEWLIANGNKAESLVIVAVPEEGKAFGKPDEFSTVPDAGQPVSIIVAQKNLDAAIDRIGEAVTMVAAHLVKRANALEAPKSIMRHRHDC